jgi:hypothetical protein
MRRHAGGVDRQCKLITASLTTCAMASMCKSWRLPIPGVNCICDAMSKYRHQHTRHRSAQQNWPTRVAHQRIRVGTPPFHPAETLADLPTFARFT